MLSLILSRVTEMNWRYGKGSVSGIVLDKDCNGGKVTIDCQFAGRETRRFRFDWDTSTVYYLGHQSCVTKQMRVK